MGIGKRLERLEEEPGGGKNKQVVLAYPHEEMEEAITRYCTERGISRKAFDKAGSTLVRLKEFCAPQRERP